MISENKMIYPFDKEKMLSYRYYTRKNKLLSLMCYEIAGVPASGLFLFFFWFLHVLSLLITKNRQIKSSHLVNFFLLAFCQVCALSGAHNLCNRLFKKLSKRQKRTYRARSHLSVQHSTSIFKLHPSARPKCDSDQ